MPNGDEDGFCNGLNSDWWACKLWDVGEFLFLFGPCSAKNHEGGRGCGVELGRIRSGGWEPRRMGAWVPGLGAWYWQPCMHGSSGVRR
jgi:hypothetical protein